MENYKSIIDTGKKCFICGERYGLQRHHTLGGSTRKLCDEDKLLVALCFKCHRKVHDVPGLVNEYRKLGQKYYERKIGSREDFMKRYHKNYL